MLKYSNNNVCFQVHPMKTEKKPHKKKKSPKGDIDDDVPAPPVYKKFVLKLKSFIANNST